MMNTTSFEKIPVQAGPWLQLYRGAMRGGRTELLKHLDVSARLQLENVIAGVVLHGFPRELEKAATGLRDECLSRGLRFGFSWGLDGSSDNDGTKLTTIEKGDCIGRTLRAVPEASNNGLNNESQWDTETSASDDMGERGAIVLGQRIRALAPNATLFTQPWPAIEQHGDVRKKPLPMDQGGVFKGWPVDEMAVYCSYFADQRYWENWPTRKDRYDYLNTWAEREWANVTKALRTVGLERPRTVTIQGYQHDEQPWTVVDAVMSRADRPVIVWSEPFPTEVTVRALRVGPELMRRGFWPVGRSHLEAIKAFQKDAKLTIDGKAGYNTMKALGV